MAGTVNNPSFAPNKDLRTPTSNLVVVVGEHERPANVALVVVKPALPALLSENFLPDPADTSDGLARLKAKFGGV